MTDTWITFGSIFDGQDLLFDAAVRIEDGVIAEVSDNPRGMRHCGHCLTPGFIDLQVNGGGGVQLNATPTADAMQKIAKAHRHFGTVGILPTVITDAPDVLENAAAAALAAQGQPGVLGLHIEGPHIAEARRGTHCAAYVRPFARSTLAIVAKLRQAAVPVMITLAPELVDLDDIRALAALGAVVSIGHTDATADQIEAAVAAGATCATHLFNAMSPMTSRAPGAVGGVLSTGINFGIICDGVHVDDRMVRLALRASSHTKPGFLVSDAMATIGGPDSFELYGKQVRLDAGRLLNAEGTLAGAHVTQAEGVQRLVTSIGLTLADALRMAVTTPAQVIGRQDLASLISRKLSDVLVMNADFEVTGDLASCLAYDAVH
ncbi:MAG: N-acetylglucosamine-6-phosphate deacetylase [Pseudomonadota bacterium]